MGGKRHARTRGTRLVKISSVGRSGTPLGTNLPHRRSPLVIHLLDVSPAIARNAPTRLCASPRRRRLLRCLRAACAAAAARRCRFTRCGASAAAFTAAAAPCITRMARCISARIKQQRAALRATRAYTALPRCVIVRTRRRTIARGAARHSMACGVTFVLPTSALPHARGGRGRKNGCADMARYHSMLTIHRAMCAWRVHALASSSGPCCLYENGRFEKGLLRRRRDPVSSGTPGGANHRRGYLAIFMVRHFRRFVGKRGCMQC